MIETINFKKSRNGYVKYSVNSDLFHLIVDDKEVLFFKFGDFILVNKFITNKVLNMFDDERINYYSKHSNDYDDDFRKVNGLFEFDKIYLDFASSGCYSSFYSQCFSKNKYNIVREFCDLDECLYGEEMVYECEREDLEILFNYNNYDSMYVFNSYGNFLFVGNKVDGVIIDDGLVPSDSRLIELDLKNRKIDAFKNNESVKELVNRNVNEINDVYVYGDDKYRHVVITSEDGFLNVNFFKLKCVGRDKYELRVKNVYNGMLSKDKSKCKVKSK